MRLVISLFFLLNSFSFMFAADMPQSNLDPLDNRYALVIGVSDYKESGHNLKFARKDADDVYRALLENGRFRKDNIRLLVNSDASRERIRMNLEGWLRQQANKSDVVFIYFSGHGTQLPDFDGDETDGMDEYLIPYDFNSTDPSSAICDDLFAYWIRNLRSEKILLILDCCFSGGAAKQKGFLLPGVKGGKITDDFSKDIEKEVPKEGTVLISASRPNQLSFESDKLENSVFSHFLLQSIDAVADRNFDNLITDEELFDFSCQKTKEFSKREYNLEQEPTMIMNIKEHICLFYLPFTKKSSTEDDNINELYYRSTQVSNADERLQILRQISAIKPTDIELNNRLAYDYWFLKDYQMAILHYKIVDEDQSQLGLHTWKYLIGDLYFEWGEMESALEWYNRYLEHESDSDVENKVASIFLQKSDTLRAIEHFNKSIIKNRFQKVAYNKLFKIYYSRNDFETSYQILNKGISVNPYDIETIYWTGIFEKYYKKNSVLGDSLLDYFSQKSGIINDLGDLQRIAPIVPEQFIYDKILSRYPYYCELYKDVIQNIAEKSPEVDIDKYFSKYLFYSKLNRDSLFVAKYER